MAKLEFGNLHDPYAVVMVTSNDTIVSHLPKIIVVMCKINELRHVIRIMDPFVNLFFTNCIQIHEIREIKSLKNYALFGIS